MQQIVTVHVMHALPTDAHMTGIWVTVDIFGPDCSHLKGTSTRPHPPGVRAPDVTEIPRSLRTKISPLALHLDVMCVIGVLWMKERAF